MEPSIRYTKAPDGVRLAYWTLGDGPPLVFLFPWASHLQLEWRISANRYLYEELATTMNSCDLTSEAQGCRSMELQSASTFTHKTSPVFSMQYRRVPLPLLPLALQLPPRSRSQRDTQTESPGFALGGPGLGERRRSAD